MLNWYSHGTIAVVALVFVPTTLRDFPIHSNLFKHKETGHANGRHITV